MSKALTTDELNEPTQKVSFCTQKRQICIILT